MALAEFLSAVRGASVAYFAYPLFTADPKRAQSANRWEEAALEVADLWLTPSIVERYDEKDFAFLPSDQRDKLTQAVQDFRRVASERSQATGSISELVHRALPLFGVLVMQVAEYITDPDAEKVATGLSAARPQFPTYVHGATFRLGNDHSGDPAVWIWLILDDNVEIEARTVLEELSRTRELIRAHLNQSGVTRWPFISVRTQSEQRDLPTRGAA